MILMKEEKFEATIKGAFVSIHPAYEYAMGDPGRVWTGGNISFRFSDIPDLIEFLRRVLAQANLNDDLLLPECPICLNNVKLTVDTQTMMEDYGENWELVLTKLQASNPDIIPYICASCRQEGSLEDFKLMAGCDDGD